MKFKIRHADKIVGFLIIVAIVSLIFVIVMIGRTQRWFSKNYSYETYAQSASGINKNMNVICRGIAIGNVKDFFLIEDNRVKVIFAIQDRYRDRAREGSIVEVVVSPIGLGGSFVFYPGLGEGLDEGAFIPMRDSAEAKDLITRGLANIPPQDDPIADLMEKANEMLDGIQEMIDGLNVPPNERSATALGQIIANVEKLTHDISADYANPEGVRKIINGDSEALNALEASLVSLSGTMDSIDKAIRFIPREMPQIINLLSEARTAIQSANDVLIALKNNPLLRGGIPEHAAIDSSGTNPRNIQF